MLLIITVDLAITSAVLFCDSYSGIASPNHPTKVDASAVSLFLIIGSAIQVILHLMLVFWFFFLVWKTFLFRFGMLRRLLFSEMPVLLFVPLNFLLFLAERILRIYYLTIDKADDGSHLWTVVSIYRNWVYMIVFWCRNLFVVFFFAAAIKAGIQVGHPSYYKPQKWLTI